jgi:hypothetical protein
MAEACLLPSTSIRCGMQPKPPAQPAQVLCDRIAGQFTAHGPLAYRLVLWHSPAQPCNARPAVSAPLLQQADHMHLAFAAAGRLRFQSQGLPAPGWRYVSWTGLA